MERFLVAFERPSVDILTEEGSLAVERAWDAWVGRLHDYQLRLPTDIDPVATAGDIEVYEVTRL